MACIFSISSGKLDIVKVLHKTGIWHKLLFSVSTSHVIKTKNHNRSMNRAKNLGYDR